MFKYKSDPTIANELIRRSLSERLISSDFGRSPWFLSLYLLFVAFCIYFLRGRFNYDDPFITFRYAQNLAQGIGFVFNPGERVLSTTSPLFAILLAVIEPIWQDIPQLANIIGVLSITFGSLILAEVSRQLGSSFNRIAALILYPSSALLLATLGSEIPLYITLGLASFYFYLGRRYSWSALTSALLVLTRPDGILIPFILVCDYLLKNRSLPPWRPVVVFISLLLPWIIFSWLYFGSPIPATLATKQHQGMMEVSTRFGPGFLRIIRGQSLYGISLVHLGLAVIGFVKIIIKDRKIFVFLAWPITYFIGYTLLGVTSYFWYYAVLIPGLIFLMSAGVIVSVEFLTRLIPKFFQQPQIQSQIASVFILLFFICLGVFQAVTILNPDQKPDPRFTVYRDVGTWLNKMTVENSRVALLEAGIVGYYSKRPIVDFAGLLQPETAMFLGKETSYEDAALFVIKQYSPEYIVLARGQLKKVEAFITTQTCKPIKRFPGEANGYPRNIIIYHCPHT